MSLPNWNIVPGLQSSRSPEWSVPLAELNPTEDEIQSVLSTLRSGWWSCGPETEALERELERSFGIRHGVAVSSATAALHLAFLALRLSRGEEVIAPSLNFVAATNMMIHMGAIPRFADVASIDTPLVSAESLERVLTPKTRGICVMHYGGYPCGMDSIVDLARKHGLWVVEDAAHAPGAAWNGISCGKWGDIGCFSFFGNKNLTCGEGGLVATESDELAKKRAAILRVQLRSLEKINSLRGERVKWYRQRLQSDRRWTIPFEDYPGTSAYHLFTVVLSPKISRAQVMRFMKARGIQTSIHYPPIHQFSCYREFSFSRSSLRLTEDLGQRILTLPLFPHMTSEQVSLVCRTFREAVARETTNE